MVPFCVYLLNVHFFCNMMNIVDIWPLVRVRVYTFGHKFPQAFTVLIRW